MIYLDIVSYLFSFFFFRLGTVYFTDGTCQTPPLLQGLWDGNCVKDERFSVFWEIESGRAPQQLRASLFLSCSPRLVIQRTLTPWMPYRDYKVRHPVAVVKLIVLPRKKLDKVSGEGNVSLSIEGGRVGVTVRVTGDNLVLRVAQDAF